jgi:AcrR family transcriptional regulator
VPTPDRTSLDEIIQAGRDILESDGLARLTMQAVADRVGVRAPSLYKRVASRDDLIGYIAEANVHDLTERLTAAVAGADSRADLAELARAFRAFAHERPAGFRLIFASGPEASRPSPASIVEASAPILGVCAELVGPENALEAARLVTAWANGFVSMELAGAFNLGGDVDRAFEFGISHLAGTLGAPAFRATARRPQPRRAPRGVP